MIDTKVKKRIDIQLLFLVYIIAAIGVLAIYSTTRLDPHRAHTMYPHIKQLLGLGIGTGAMIAIALFDFHFYERLLWPLYWFNLLQLLLTKIPRLAVKTLGGARWVKLGPIQYQPSEIAKIILILTLAAFLLKYRKRLHEPKYLLLSFAFILPPMLMIAAQPDLGSSLVLVVVWLGMVYVSGAKLKHLAAIFGAGLILFTGMAVTGIGLKKWQQARIKTLISPDKVTKNDRYHTEEARIAIGSGGVFGKGMFKNNFITQGHLPEKESDFIFSDIGEEYGFVGCLSVMGLYALLIWRAIRIVALSDEDPYGKMIAAGIVSLITFHVIENIGMNVGVMPVAGIPLLLLSCGTTSVLMTMICIGLLEGVMIHRHKLMF